MYRNVSFASPINFFLHPNTYLVKREVDNFTERLQQSGSSAWCCRLGSHAWTVSVNPFVSFPPLGSPRSPRLLQWQIHCRRRCSCRCCCCCDELYCCHPRHTLNEDNTAGTRELPVCSFLQLVVIYVLATSCKKETRLKTKPHLSPLSPYTAW